jgi:hypothetical protein
LKNYGVLNPAQAETVKNKIKRTNLERYGTENAAASDIIKEKIKTIVSNKDDIWKQDKVNRTRETCLLKYGFSSPTQNDVVKVKTKETNLRKYGTEYAFNSPEIRAKIHATNVERYGNINPFASELIKTQIKESNMILYGVEYTTQRPNILEKALSSAYKYKEYKFPDGTIVKYQGYEHLAFDELLQYGFDLTTFKCLKSDVPKIQYTYDAMIEYTFLIYSFLQRTLL